MTTYFNYQAQLRSIDLSRAISIPRGVGPFVGFGSGEIVSSNSGGGNNTTLGSFVIKLSSGYYGYTSPSPNVEPYRKNYSFIVPLIKDLQSKHGIFTNEQVALRLNSQETQDSTNAPVTFGIITKDGFIAVNNIQSVWTVPILNYTSQSIPREVVVFARHRYIDEAVDNPITLEAYALTYDPEGQNHLQGRSSGYTDINSFYDLYRRSLNIYYNRSEEPDFAKYNPLSNENGLGLKLSYSDLLGYVESRCEAYSKDKSELTLVGIYGKGSFVDNSNSELESFSIVPYEGKWPYELPFNTAVMNGITADLSNLRGLMDGFPFNWPNSGESLNIMGYIDAKIQELSESLKSDNSVTIPSGLICLWADADNIPPGWHEYTPAKGKIVIGFVSGGIPAGPNGTKVLDQIGITYGTDSDWLMELSAEDLPRHHHAIAAINLAFTNDGVRYDDPGLTDWKNYDSSVKSTSDNAYASTNYARMGIQNGAIKTGPNLTVTGDSTPVSSNNMQNSTVVKFQKILPAVTLMYIQRD